jgi:hypothetical protein
VFPWGSSAQLSLLQKMPPRAALPINEHYKSQEKKRVIGVTKGAAPYAKKERKMLIFPELRSFRNVPFEP